MDDPSNRILAILNVFGLLHVSETETVITITRATGARFWRHVTISAELVPG